MLPNPDTAAVRPGAASDGALIHIMFYTDPLCCWSWAFEAHWRRMRSAFAGPVAWRYRMGGLIADWQSFDDPLNAVTRPAQMGPHWYEVRGASGMPMDEGIWLEDPPASSYPACVAVKAAEMQGPAAGERYLRRLREAVMLERRNIARRQVLVDLAEELAADPSGGIDPQRFRADLDGRAALDAFREDLKDASYREIARFPTLILRHVHGPALMIVGYRPYEALREALAWLAPDLRPAPVPDDPVAYAARWPSITAEEVAAGLDLPPEAVAARLTEGVEQGLLARGLRGQTAVYGAPATLPL